MRIVGVAGSPGAVERLRVGRVESGSATETLYEIRIGERPAPDGRDIGQAGLDIRRRRFERPVDTVDQQRLRPELANTAQELFVAAMRR